MKVGTGPTVGLVARCAHPVDFAPAWVLVTNHGLGPVAAAQAGDLEALQILVGQIRDVYIQDRVARQGFGAQPLHQLAGYPRSGLEMLGANVRDRQGQRRITEMPTLHRSGHGARIQHVIAQIGAGIDARHDHVRLVLQ